VERGGGRHTCRRCGWCCQNQLIGVSTAEIRAISYHLKRKPQGQLENHIMSCLAYDGTLSQQDPRHEQYGEHLLDFFEPCEAIVFGDTALVRTHVVRLLPRSRRCIFHDPVSRNCFIYPARPLTCRMFPYEVKDGRLVMVDETDECPGVGLGQPLNLKHHAALSKMCRELLLRDDAIFWRFVQQEGLAKESTNIYTIRYGPEFSRLHPIDPFVELGLLPSTQSPHPLSGR
jgi:Fe-S-cluster containining protein